MKQLLTTRIVLTACLMMSGWLSALAQCAMCTKTASQLGEKPAEGMNSGIIYLMLAPLAIMGVIAYRWWKNRGAE
ncbi:MAG: hypothetical protein ACKO5C_06615 [Ferruginibacter sp.]